MAVGGHNFYPNVPLKDRHHAFEPYWQKKLSQPSWLRRAFRWINRRIVKGE